MRAACAVELIFIPHHLSTTTYPASTMPLRAGADRFVLFGEPMAVLVGDALLAHGIEILSDVPRAQAAGTGCPPAGSRPPARALA